MKNVKNQFLVLLVMLLVAGLIGCKSQNVEKDTPQNTAEEGEEKITLTVMLAWMIGEDRWEEFYKKPAEEKFPHLTLERIEGDAGDRETLEKTFAAGIKPDMIMVSHPSQIQLLQEYGLAMDMRDMIDQYNFDLTRYDDDYLAEWLSWTGGEIWSLPFVSQKYALHYNKDIFDLFGVEYPADNLTWDEVIELAMKVTGERNDVEYHGLYMQHDASQTLSQVMGDTLYVDPETDEVLWTERQEVSDYFALVEQMKSIPGNDLGEIETDGIAFIDAFQQIRNLAMIPHQFLEALPEDLNWDIATYPVWSQAPGIQPNQSGWALGVTDISEHKDAAFELLKFWYSDEQILSKGNSAVTTPFNHLFEDGAVEEALKNDPNRSYLADLNIDSLFMNKPGGGTSEKRSIYDAGAQDVIGGSGFEFYDSDQDRNEFLRDLKQKEEQRIVEEKSTK